MPNVAFKTPEGKIAVIVLNDSDSDQKFNIKIEEETFEVTLSKGCLLYTSDAADERTSVDLGGRRIIKKKKKTNLATVIIFK